MPDEQPDQTDHPITVFWRPGCGFCASLLRGLDQSGLRYARADIWEDEDAAAYVRSVARGNETVPTVRIGDTALVNPSAQQVLSTPSPPRHPITSPTATSHRNRVGCPR